MDQETIMEMLRKVQRSGASTTTTETLEDYDLGGVECEKCNNTGTILENRDGILYSRECSCMATRRALRRIRQSGMSDMLDRYTLQNYETPTDEMKRIKQLAAQFVNESEGWLYISGKSGSGKTHICTAICSVMIKRGVDVYYMQWRDESTNLKSIITDAEAYESKMKKLKRISVLYIDDFLKGGDTDADIRLAFEIINSRYNDKKLRTLISSETSIDALLNRDEALGGRIYERSKGYRIQAPCKNWRLRK